VSLPPSIKGETEGAYNKRITQDAKNDLLHLDAKIVRPGGAGSGIELCDALASDGEFVHVKRKTRSSTLSHLFSQGTVSAATFFGDGTYRDRLRNEVLGDGDLSEAEKQQWLALIPPASVEPNRDSYSVTYAIVANANPANENWLPFFSKLNLMQHGKQLGGMGLRANLKRISVVDADVEGRSV
jgi:uncharacterized protein (TIGR04141 family)